MNIYKREAKGFLTEKGNYMKMTLGTLLCIAVVMIPILLSIFSLTLAITLGFNEEAADTIIGIIILVCTLMLTIPCVMGFLSMSSRLSYGEDLPLLAMFGRLASFKKYLSSLGFSLAVAVFVAIPQLAFIPIDTFLSVALLEVKLGGLYGFIKFCFLTVIYLVMFIFLSRLFLVPYFLMRDIPFNQAVKKSIAATKSKPMIMLEYLFSFIPLILLSIASVFTFFIVYTIPYMIATYVAMGNNLSKSTEEIQIYE